MKPVFFRGQLPVEEEIYAAIGKQKSFVVNEYLEEQLENHVPPMRKGKPKGSKIGFPRNKLIASILWALTSWTLKECAYYAGISHGLMRKWSSQADFRQKGLSHIAEVNERLAKRWRRQ